MRLWESQKHSEKSRDEKILLIEVTQRRVIIMGIKNYPSGPSGRTVIDKEFLSGKSCSLDKEGCTGIEIEH